MDTPSSHQAFTNLQKDKFELERNTLPADLSAGLPDSYGDNRLVMMARDPFWIFCYWEFTPERIAGLRESAGSDVWENSALILRIFDTTDRGERSLESCPSTDVEVTNKQARSWYVKVPQAGRAYQIELGLRVADGRFYSFLTSNRIAMPYGKVSDKTDSQFMAVGVSTIEEEWRKFQDIAGNTSSIGRGSADLSKTMAQRWEFLKSVFSGSSWTGSSSAMMTPPNDEKKS